MICEVRHHLKHIIMKWRPVFYLGYFRLSYANLGAGYTDTMHDWQETMDAYEGSRCTSDHRRFHSPPFCSNYQMFLKAKVINPPYSRTLFLLRNIYFVVFSFLVIVEVVWTCEIRETYPRGYVKLDYRQKQIPALTSVRADASFVV